MTRIRGDVKARSAGVYGTSHFDLAELVWTLRDWPFEASAVARDVLVALFSEDLPPRLLGELCTKSLPFGTGLGLFFYEFRDDLVDVDVDCHDVLFIPSISDLSSPITLSSRRTAALSE